MSKFSRLIFAVINRSKIKRELASEFNAVFYKSTFCSDLSAWIDPIDQYLLVGLWKGYDPSPQFSVPHYISAMGDANLSSAEPLSHYLKSRDMFGIAATASDKKDAYVSKRFLEIFDEAYYRSIVPADEIGDMPAIEHYRKKGWVKGYAPNATFSVHQYKYMYPDVSTEPVEDYILFGQNGQRCMSAKDAIVEALYKKRRINAKEKRFYINLLNKVAELQPIFQERWGLLCNGMEGTDKIRGFINHWIFFFSTVRKDCFAQILFEQINICNAVGFDNHISLYASRPHSYEGELSISFMHKGEELFLFSFSIFPGSIFNLADENVIFLTRVQGAPGKFDLNRQVTKELKDVTPCHALFSALQGLALSWGISKVVAVGAERQLAYTEERKSRFTQVYDAFFQAKSGILISDNLYLFKFPAQHKPINFIRRDHRNRTLEKRKLKSLITSETYSKSIELRAENKLRPERKYD